MIIMASGRWYQMVEPNGTLVQTSQYWAPGITLSFTRMPTFFHCSAAACACATPQGRSLGT